MVMGILKNSIIVDILHDLLGLDELKDPLLGLYEEVEL
jgi:hypothetical protein